MDAKKQFLLTFLSERIQLQIPLYQRNYSWTKKECKTLLDDLINIGVSAEDKTHFLGSVVYLKEYTPSVSPIDKLILIDGQQRITTVMLLISAIASYINKSPDNFDIDPEYLSSYYLINEREQNNKYKLLLSNYDNYTLQKIIDNIGNYENISWDDDDSQRLKDNFQFFIKEINEFNFEKIYQGLNKLIIIQIALEPNLDNPQLIFESLNSTGRELNKSDLIRNYLLMGLSYEEQENLYVNYWSKIESGFRTSTYVEFDDFIKYYLTIKFKGDNPTDKNLYQSFKKYASTINNKEDLVEDMYKYANYLFKIVNNEDDDVDLSKKLVNINSLKVKSIYSFLLNVYDDYENNIINNNEFYEILDILEIYIIRRNVSGLKNYFSNVFNKLYWKMNKNEYLSSFKKILLLNNATSEKFPKDDELFRTIKNIEISQNKHYILSKIENHLRNNTINLENYKVEYILPRNNLNNDWIKMLGEDYVEIQKNYSKTLGNLTLLPKTMNKESFEFKCNSEKGYNSSELLINKDISSAGTWNKENIVNRSQNLCKYLLEIWPYPHLNEIKNKNNIKHTNLKNQQSILKYLTNNPINTTIISELTNRILALDSEIEKITYDTSIEFIKDEYIIAKIIPKKNYINILLDTPVNKLNDPKHLSNDISHLDDEFENTSVIIDNVNDTDYVFQLIKQEYGYLIH